MRSFFLEFPTRIGVPLLVSLMHAVLRRPFLAAWVNSFLLRWPVLHYRLRGLAGQPPQIDSQIDQEPMLSFEQKLKFASPNVLTVYERLKSARDCAEC